MERKGESKESARQKSRRQYRRSSPAQIPEKFAPALICGCPIRSTLAQRILPTIFTILEPSIRRKIASRLLAANSRSVIARRIKSTRRQRLVASFPAMLDFPPAT